MDLAGVLKSEIALVNWELVDDDGLVVTFLDTGITVHILLEHGILVLVMHKHEFVCSHL